MNESTEKSESRLFGLRYLASYINSSRDIDPDHFDNDMIEELFLLAYMARLNKFRKSQLGQDVFALAMSGFKHNGYFVEIGAFDAVSHSNTYLLETVYGWSGVMAEPNPERQQNLRANRKAKLVPKAVWNESGLTLAFHATADSALSALGGVVQNDQHDRTEYKQYSVETITLNDLLIQNNCPDIIDYMSIDVEGAELEVLQGLNFSAWKINTLSIEFNHDMKRLEKLDKIMKVNGYQRVFSTISDFDAFYARKDVLSKWRIFIDSISSPLSL